MMGARGPRRKDTILRDLKAAQGRVRMFLTRHSIEEFEPRLSAERGSAIRVASESA